jgi:FlgD Ig-like domain
VTLFARAVFVLLVGATFAAFFVAQRLKGGPPVAKLVDMPTAFSPNGDGRKDVQPIGVRIKHGDDVTLTVVDATGSDVRRIASGVPVRAGDVVRAGWNGRTEGGSRAPDGRYRVRVNLRREGRAAVLRPGFYLDTTPPRPAVFVARDRWITGPVAGPVPFRLQHAASSRSIEMSVLRTDRGAPRPVAGFTLPRGARGGSWDGRVAGAPAPPGTYLLVATVRDLAGNVGASAPPRPAPELLRGRAGISVRALLARPPVDPVLAGRPIRFAVDSRGRPFRWSVRRVGAARPVSRGRAGDGGRLTVRAPDGPSGVYVLALRAGTDRTRVPFAVQGTKSYSMLVVLPGITWFGRDELDDDGDGLPNTLPAGGPAGYPRLLADGMPAGFASGLAPLLTFLDRQRVRYDLTSDLTLSASRSGLSHERPGVLLPAPLQWVSTELARRLRRYVADGGRLAYFGPDSLRRGVVVARDRLLRPLPQTGEDPFGVRLRAPRGLPARVGPLQPIADAGGTGLLTGVERLPGFREVEESSGGERPLAALAAVDARAQDAAEAAGQPLPPSYPALALWRVGKGSVIRVGLPEWGARLAARRPPVEQLTRNIADLVRGVKPRIHSY